jgi:pSer/pThr/pTyr-binding forkhead associated (FHA) protein
MELSRERLILFTGAGLLGGLAGWAAADPLADVGNVYQRALLLGAVTGIFVGIFLGAIEGLSVGHKNQTMQGVLLGGLFGIAGGAVGLLFGEVAFGVLGGLGGRIIGWGIFGAAIGLGVGWIGHSFARLRNGGLGGAIGGAIGGAFYQLVTTPLPQTAGRAIALALLGAMIGLGIGLVGEILKRGWLMVIRSQSRNAREGREYPLVKAKTRIGRAEESDVGLFGDQSVANFHAMVERQKGKFLVARGEGSVRVNQQPVTQPVQLKNGDRVEVGGTLFLFRERVSALLVLLLCGVTVAFAADPIVVSVTSPRLENFPNGGAVGLYFSATDTQGKPVGQLTPEHIDIMEDGQKVQIVDFRGEEQGRAVDIVVVFDVTESMGPFINGMKDATVDFADRLSKANRDYRLGLVTFEDYVMRQEPIFTRSAAEFKSWVGALQAAGGGDIPENALDALMAATKFPFRPDAQAILILITDAPNHFRGDGSEKNNPYGQEFTQLVVDDVVNELKKTGVNVFAIAPPPFAAPDLFKVAKETGGRHYNTFNEGRRFPELISEIGRSLASQYFLSYASPRPVEDGTQRNISLTVNYDSASGGDRTSYQVRGVGGARVVTPTTPAGPGTAPARERAVVAYGWWNVLIPLLSGVGLFLLARMRVGQLPTEALSRFTSTASPTGAVNAPVVAERPVSYARLVRQSPLDEVPREIAFTRDEFVIGRGEECEVVISHTSISREHARVKKLKPGYVVFDLKSKNGTTINGRPIVENLLKEGMTIKFGDVEFIFRAAGS